MNLKQILTPEDNCYSCHFSRRGSDGCYTSIGCKLGVFRTTNDDCKKEEGRYPGFSPYHKIHKDCPLLRIKCVNCKHSKQWPDGCYYCTKEGADCLSVACIEFEEVK